MTNKPVDSSQLVIGDRIVGTNDTQLQFSFETFNITKLSLFVAAVGGSFQSQTVTVEGSVDNTNWITVNQFSLSSSPKKYHYGGLITTQENDTNVLDFQYLRITVPALGSGISCVVTYTGKP